MSDGSASPFRRSALPQPHRDVSYAISELGATCAVGIPGKDNKHPSEEWSKVTYRDLDTFIRVWRRKGCGSVFVICGPSHIVDLDIDGSVGRASWDDIREGREPTVTAALRTPNGWHLLYEVNGERYKTSQQEIAPKIDTRAWGGLFKLHDPSEPERRLVEHRRPAPLPEWLAAIWPKAGSSVSHEGSRVPRTGLSALAARYAAGEYGAQRTFLLDYMLEAQRRYPLTIAKVLTYEKAQELPQLKPKPWDHKAIDGLVKPGVIPDADDREAELLATPIRRSR